MIKIFKTTKDGLKEIWEIEKNCWVNFSKPTNEELGKLLEKLNIPLNFLTDPLDVDERARIEMEDKCVLIILRISHFDEKNVDISYITLPIGIILIEDLVITVCSKEIV